MHRLAARLRAPDPCADRRSPTTGLPMRSRVVQSARSGVRGAGGAEFSPVRGGLGNRSRREGPRAARRARTENFPVASLLFPRRLRPHLRAIYGFARLVDILGDEVEGDRLAALDE